MLVAFLSTALCFCSQDPINQSNEKEELSLSKSSAVASSDVQTSLIHPEPKGPIRTTALLESFTRSTELFARSIDTVLQENMMMKIRIRELEAQVSSMKTEKTLPSETSYNFTMEESQRSYSISSSSGALQKQICVKPLKGFDTRYAFTPEEKKKLDDVYSAVPELHARAVSKVLSGSVKKPASLSFKTVQAYILSTGGSLQEYQRLYAKVIRSSVKK